jgi:hypothetical protein
MSRTRQKSKDVLAEKYSPSPPCSCNICVGYCTRPGWWTVRQAVQAIRAGYEKRMMLEVSPELTFGVLSPAFKGCEGMFALNEYASNGCTFFVNGGCELHGTDHQPLECCYCHHDRPGMGPKCHADLEKDWNTHAGQNLVLKWIKLTGSVIGLRNRFACKK